MTFYVLMTLPDDTQRYRWLAKWRDHRRAPPAAPQGRGHPFPSTKSCLLKIKIEKFWAPTLSDRPRQTI
jgi:hypothetical protein